MWRIINAFPVTRVGLEHHFQLRSLNADGLAAVFDKEFSLMIFGCHSTPPPTTRRVTPTALPDLISSRPVRRSRSSMWQLSLWPLMWPSAVLAANFHLCGCRPLAALKSASFQFTPLPIPIPDSPCRMSFLPSPVTARWGLMTGSLLSLLVPYWIGSGRNLAQLVGSVNWKISSQDFTLINIRCTQGIAETYHWMSSKNTSPY